MREILPLKVEVNEKSEAFQKLKKERLRLAESVNRYKNMLGSLLDSQPYFENTNKEETVIRTKEIISTQAMVSLLEQEIKEIDNKIAELMEIKEIPPEPPKEKK